eukprot:PhF_6_TR22313/c0_g1_i1/m.31580
MPKRNEDGLPIPNSEVETLSSPSPSSLVLCQHPSSLFNCPDLQIWQQYYPGTKYYTEALLRKASKKNSNTLIELDRKLRGWSQTSTPLQDITHNSVYEHIVDVMQWKLMRGQFRPGLLQALRNKNTPQVMYDVYCRALHRLQQDSIIAAVQELEKGLHGVGPATATAILRFAPVGKGNKRIEVPFFADEAALIALRLSALKDVPYTMRAVESYVAVLVAKREVNGWCGKDCVDRGDDQNHNNTNVVVVESLGDMADALWAHAILTGGSNTTKK